MLAFQGSPSARREVTTAEIVASRAALVRVWPSAVRTLTCESRRRNGVALRNHRQARGEVLFYCLIDRSRQTRSPNLVRRQTGGAANRAASKVDPRISFYVDPAVARLLHRFGPE